MIFFKIKFDPLSYNQDQEGYTLNEEDTNSFVSSIQEQQNNVKQMVRSLVWPRFSVDVR